MPLLGGRNTSVHAFEIPVQGLLALILTFVFYFVFFLSCLFVDISLANSVAYGWKGWQQQSEQIKVSNDALGTFLHFHFADVSLSHSHW
jgi:hypothetical protein